MSGVVMCLNYNMWYYINFIWWIVVCSPFHRARFSTHTSFAPGDHEGSNEWNFATAFDFSWAGAPSLKRLVNGKITGNLHISSENRWFPVDFPFRHSIESQGFLESFWRNCIVEISWEIHVTVCVYMWVIETVAYPEMAICFYVNFRWQTSGRNGILYPTLPNQFSDKPMLHWPRKARFSFGCADSTCAPTVWCPRHWGWEWSDVFLLFVKIMIHSPVMSSSH